MAKPGRPRKETIHVPLKLSLTPGEDDDLIEWFENLPPDISRAKAVVIALRMGGMDAAQEEINESTDQLVDSLLDLS